MDGDKLGLIVAGSVVTIIIIAVCLLLGFVPAIATATAKEVLIGLIGLGTSMTTGILSWMGRGWYEKAKEKEEVKDVKEG